MDPVHLGGRTLNRLGMSVARLRGVGMWGEPVQRGRAIATIRRALDLGVEIIEVPLPFGPFADVVRDAAVADVFVVARLTGPVHDVAVLRQRLGRLPDLLLAHEHLLDDMVEWPVRLGAVVGPRAHYPIFDHQLGAVRGPYPAVRSMVEWCEARAIPYMAPSVSILAAGRHTVALPAPASPAEVERLYADPPPIPPTAEPG